MRQPTSILVAAAMIAVAAFVIAPARAAPIRMAPPVAADVSATGEIVKVYDRYRHHRHHRRQHSTYRRHHRPQFFFGFPFAFAPHTYRQPYYQDCFRTWDGRVYCRR